MTDIYLITYKGQTESPYLWTADNSWQAEKVKEILEQRFPDREWRVEQKDVS